MEHMEIESHEGKKQDEEGHHHNNEVARLEEYKKFIDAKTALRQSNLNPERPDASHLRTLDSSIKRNTAVIKKLRVINDEQKDGLMEELKSVNLSKFVSEAVSYISEAKLRSADIQAAVQICSLLHQRYKDFSPCLIQGLLKAFFPGKSGDDIDSDKNSRAMKKRSTLKLLMELYFVGIVEDASTFINIIKDLTSVEHLKDRETTQTNLSLLASFARQGKHFLGLQKHGQEAYDEFFMGLNVTDDLKTFFKKALSSYYDAAVAVLQSEHASLRALESENAKILNAKGELSDENTALYEKLRKSFDQLLRCVSSLAEALDMQPPVMPDDGHTTRVTTVAELSPSGKDFSAVEPIWDDEDTKAFYESLPDLRVFVPGVLLGEAEPKLVDQHGKVNEQTGEPKLEQGTEVQNNAETSVPEHQLEGQTNVGSKNRENKDKTGKEISKEKDADQKGDTEREKARVTDGASLDSLLQRLPRCVSRDLIDQLTVEFCYLNSKANRKKLARVLFNVPRTSLELLPYYSRLVATLSTCMKDLPSMLLSMLEEEFNFLMNKKDQIKIETKIRNIRFIGELCKFNIAPSSLVFSCLKACLDDFSHHNIDVACNLLETCGRFLYLSQGTTVRMANMLEILKRLKNVKNLDPHHSTLVENAYYLCKPPERSARVSKVRPPLHQYIRKLLFSDLDKTSVQHVLRQLRKLPWAECEQYLVKCFLKVHKGKYSQVHLIALLTAGLSHYHDDFHVAVVDEVLEEIRVGLELNDYAMQQRQLAHMRFLGELYNYEHIDSSVIFETMYLIIVFGHGTPEQDLLDPPEDFFRIRMIVTLLQTCGHYFDRGSSKRKLDRFLLHFHRSKTKPAAMGTQTSEAEKEMRAWCVALPKVELHAHLNGSVRNSTLLELAKELGDKGVIVYEDVKDVIMKNDRSLPECFRLFDLFHILTTDHDTVTRIAKEVVGDFAAENVVYLEIRTTPKNNEAKGMTKRSYMNAVVKGLKSVEDVDVVLNDEKISCAPMSDFGGDTKRKKIYVRLLLSIDRRETTSAALDTVNLALELKDEGVIGIDLSGNPVVGEWETYLPALERAKELGIPTTIHCGEVPNRKEIQAMLDFCPQRLGHVCCLDDEEWKKLKSSMIPVEICLTSNVMTGGTPSLELHHFADLYNAKHPLSICTDDSGLFSTSLSNEYYLVASTFGLSKAELFRLAQSAVEFVFADDEVKKSLRAAFEHAAA